MTCSSLKKGETLTFVNDDTVPHNIISTSKGNEFNLGSQPPGARDGPRSTPRPSASAS